MLGAIVVCSTVQSYAADGAVGKPAAPENQNASVVQAKSFGGLPSIPLSFGDAGELVLSGNGAAYQLKTDLSHFSVDLGVGGRQQNGVSAGLRFARSIGESSALGTVLNFNQQKSEALLNGVTDFTPLGLRLQAAVNYMQGKQTFDFFRSTETAKLSQIGFFGSAQWIRPGVEDLGWHSIGTTVWTARAKNHSQFSRQVYVDDMPDVWTITEDRRLISTGKVKGSSVDFQYAPLMNMVVNGSMGIESVTFPFSDGSADKATKPYFDGKVSYAPHPNHAISLAYKSGATESRVSADWQTGALTVSAYRAQGKDGVGNTRGLSANLDLIKLFSKDRSRNSDAPLAIRLRPKMNDNATQRLQQVVTRPSQLPSNFLAKVDPTGVRQLKINKNTLPEGSIIDAEGNIRIPVGEGAGSIMMAKINNTQQGEVPALRMDNNHLVVDIAQLSRPQSTDNYFVRVNDGRGVGYAVLFDVVKDA